MKFSNLTPEYKTLDNDREYLRYLIKKSSGGSPEFTENPCVEELADVKEVIDALFGIRGVRMLRVCRRERGRREEGLVGGFACWGL